MNAIFLPPVIVVILTAPLGTTILGWVAVSQILRSEGKLRGLGLALFDALLFPLLVINALMAIASMRLGEKVMEAIGIEGSRSGWLLSTVVVLIIIDIVVIRWAWRETLHRGIRGLLRVVMITALIIAALASLYVSLPLYLRHVRLSERLATKAEPPQAPNMTADAKRWEPGIYAATRQEEGVVLRVVLLAEKKLQFYTGERLLPVFWAQADAPTDVFIAVREGGLAVGSGMVSLADPLHLGEVVFSEVFPDLKAGVDDIVLGTEDGNIPFGVRLISTTAAEASAIRNHEPFRGAAPVALPTPKASPEHIARAFMEAIRDGDMAVAVAWMDPKLKAREEYSPHLELVSKTLRDEIYADHLDRLTQFTETVDTTLDGTTRIVTIRIAAPSGEWESYYPYGLALILVSTPDGWRVAHFDGSAPGKSLSDFTRAVIGGRSDSRPGITQIDLLDVDAHKGPVVLDLASGELLDVPKDVSSEGDFTAHFNRLGKGDIAWDGAIITLRSARLSEWLDDGWTLRNPERELDGSGVYRITVPTRLRITTAEGGHYIVDVKEKIENEKGVRIEYQPKDLSAAPAETGKNAPEATKPPEIQSPPEGAEISLDSQRQAVFHTVIREFLTECKTAEIDTLAKMEKQLGVDILREREQEGEDPKKLNRNLWHPVLREIIERPHELRPYEAIRQTYVAEPSPYRQEAILLLKVMGDESPETEAFRHVIGPLGRPLGEFMIIEGRPCAVGKGGVVAFQSLEEISKLGVHSLEVQKVNGSAIKAPVIIQITGNGKFPPAAYYVVRGYQTAELGSGIPASEDTNATVPQTDHQLRFRFLATTVLATTKEHKMTSQIRNQAES